MKTIFQIFLLNFEICLFSFLSESLEDWEFRFGSRQKFCDTFVFLPWFSLGVLLCDESSEICVGWNGGGGEKHGDPPPRPFHKIVKMGFTNLKFFGGRLLRIFVWFVKSTWITLFFDALNKKKRTFLVIFYHITNKCAAFFFWKIHFSPKDYFSRNKSIQGNGLETFLVMKHNYTSFMAIIWSYIKNIPVLPQGLKTIENFWKKV